MIRWGEKKSVLPAQSHGACKLCVYVILSPLWHILFCQYYPPTFIQSWFILSRNSFCVSSKFLLYDWILLLKYFLSLLCVLYLLGESGVPNVYLALKIRHCKLQISQLCIIILWLRHFCVPVDILMLLHLIFKLNAVNNFQASLRNISKVLGNIACFKNYFSRIK